MLIVLDGYIASLGSTKVYALRIGQLNSQLNVTTECVVINNVQYNILSRIFFGESKSLRAAFNGEVHSLLCTIFLCRRNLEIHGSLKSRQ